MSENSTNEFPDYITFPRTFEKYKWYKPLLTIVVTVVVYAIFQGILGIIFGAIYGHDFISAMFTLKYETLTSSDATVYLSYLSVGIFIPSIYIASRIVRDRPFSSYSSSRGGWNWKIYLKCLTIPLIIYVIYNAINFAIHGANGNASQISSIALIICLIIIPFQCIAEEYVFRGLLMQTIGSWFKIPVLSIIIQAIIFGIGHSYDAMGIITVFGSGIILGVLAWCTNGLEASSALHSINNLFSFYLAVLGLSSISSTVSMWDFIAGTVVTLISALAIYYIGNEKEWFSENTSD